MSFNASELNSNLTKSITSTLVDAILGDIHNSVQQVVSETSSNIYDELKSMGYCVNQNSTEMQKFLNKNSELEASVALKLFLKKVLESYNREHDLNIKEHLKEQIDELKLTSTPNPKFMVSESGEYYSLENYEYVKQPNVIFVNADGTYTTKEKIKGCTDDYLIIRYDTNNKAISLKVINKKNITYRSKELVAYKLKLKKELVKRFKLSGYSGNSTNVLLEIANMFIAPTASGYYIDEKYNIFKWNEKTVQFEKELRCGLKPGAPLITDYEVKDKVVIRTDYDGKGLR